MIEARLVLEDESVWYGFAEQAFPQAVGEVVFNTSMAGGQAVVTNPANAGRIVVMTFPLIGTYGVQPGESEADAPVVAALVTRETETQPHHVRSRENFPEFMRRAGIPVCAGFDTRALVRHLRRHGVMRGVLTSDPQAGVPALADLARRHVDRDWIEHVTCRHPYSEGDGRVHVAVLDFGLSRSSLQALLALHCKVTVFPASSTPDAIFAAAPDALVLSSGPDAPEALDRYLPAVSQMLEKIPTFGLGAGMLALARACGAHTVRLPFGHRGSGHPVRDLASGRAAMTVQNHGHSLDDDSLAAAGLQATHRHVNDGSIEGIRHATRPLSGILFELETASAPSLSHASLQRFLQSVEQRVTPGA